jgi:hypothetical protein
VTRRQKTTAGLAALVVAGGFLAVAVIPGASPGGSSSSSVFGSAGSSVGSTATEGAPQPASGAADRAPSTVEPATSALTATRVVRTGDLSLVVPSISSAMARLTSLASAAGGYVQSSDTTAGGTTEPGTTVTGTTVTGTTVSGPPSGDITVRVPAGDFDSAVAAAQRLGRTQSLTTSATDVTGRYVDLVAQATALRRTRSTYLSILSTARTIGATLSVQQRIQDVQSQLDRIEGQRKVLAAQSSDATLSVSLTQKGAKSPVAPVSTGIGAAWHRSVHRFSVGLDAVVGALGPLLLAVLLLAVVAAIGLGGYRGTRRVMARRRILTSDVVSS